MVVSKSIKNVLVCLDGMVGLGKGGVSITKKVTLVLGSYGFIGEHLHDMISGLMMSTFVAKLTPLLSPLYLRCWILFSSSAASVLVAPLPT